MISFVKSLFYFVMFSVNAFFVVQNGITTFFSHMSSGINIVGFALALVSSIYFGPGALQFIDGLFRFKYGVSK